MLLAGPLYKFAIFVHFCTPGNKWPIRDTIRRTMLRASPGDFARCAAEWLISIFRNGKPIERLGRKTIGPSRYAGQPATVSPARAGTCIERWVMNRQLPSRAVPHPLMPSWPRCLFRHIVSALALVPFLAGADDGFGAHAFEQAASSLKGTHLIELRQGSDLSRKASDLQFGGYESAQGQWIAMRPFYRTKWTDARISWMTAISPSAGLIWGLSTGERAEKYTIAPSMKLGFVLTSEPRGNAFFSLRATTVVGGQLRERPCSADYGAIGGVQAVNCRLAASTMAPAETLKYLLQERPRGRNSVTLEYKLLF